MKKTELLQTMRKERADWVATLESVGEARMLLTGVAGSWSVKDIVAHVTAYERWLVVWLKAAARGQLPPASALEDPDVDRRNAWIFAHTCDRSLQDVLAESERVFQQLEAQVARTAETDLVEAHRTAWFVVPYWRESRPLWKCIAGDSYEHYHQHIPTIEAWLAEQGQAGPAA